VSGLDGRRVVVVGASAGIGRAFAVQAAAEGADLVLAARRQDVLDVVVGEAGSGTGVTLDVCDPAGRAAFVEQLADGPPVDLVLVTVGMADLRPLSDTDEERWSAMLATNLVGVTRLLDEIRPVLAPTGILAVTSSETGRKPRMGLVPYAATKAGLEAVLCGLRMEHPGLRVSCIVIGATYPTDFGNGFEMDHLVTSMKSWEHHGFLNQAYMDPEDVGAVLVDLYATALRHPGVGVEEITLRSPSPVLGVETPS
jgi:NAD(P)-dependent dehydrogenase (short-subunit alcohol dehydrogenase family)